MALAAAAGVCLGEDAVVDLESTCVMDVMQSFT